MPENSPRDNACVRTPVPHAPCVHAARTIFASPQIYSNKCTHLCFSQINMKVCRICWVSICGHSIYSCSSLCVYFFAEISQSKSETKKKLNALFQQLALCGVGVCVCGDRTHFNANGTMRPRQVTTPKFVIKRIKCVSVVQHRKLRVLRHIHLFLLHYCYHQFYYYYYFVLFAHVSITLCLEQSASFV